MLKFNLSWLYQIINDLLKICFIYLHVSPLLNIRSDYIKISLKKFV